MTFATLFCLMFIGHLVGDYLLQNEWMAVTKSTKGLPGHISCTAHVGVYTLAMCTALHMFRWDWHGWNIHSWHCLYLIGAWYMALVLAFVGRHHTKKESAFVIGLLIFGMAHSLTHLWLVAAIAIPHWLIDRTGFAALFLKWKNGIKPWDVLKDNEIHFAPKQVWQVAFAAPVYIVNDNAMHFLLMLPILRYLAR